MFVGDVLNELNKMVLVFYLFLSVREWTLMFCL